MIKDLVSIIVPVYNIENYIEDCIESIVSQKYENIEIIVIDDGSTDKSGLICDRLELKYEKVTVFHQKNLGVSSGRNKGLEMAKGEYIAFVDGDDTISRYYIQEAVDNIKKLNLDVVIGGMRYIYPEKHTDFVIKTYENVKIYEKYKEEFIYHLLTGESAKNTIELTGCVHSGPCARVYKKSLIGDIRFKTNIFLAEDLVFNFQVMINAKKIGVSNKIWYYYNQRNSSITKIAKKEAIQNFYNIANYAKQFNKELDNKYKEAWDIEVLSQFGYAFQRGIVSKQLDYTFFQKCRLLKKIVNDEKLREYFLEIDVKRLPLKKKILLLIFKYKLIVLGIFITSLFVKTLK